MDATPSILRRPLHLVFALGLISLASCETLKAPGSTADWFARNNKAHEKEAQAYRNQWQTRRDRAAVRWLLSTQIHNGLTPEQVNERLGDTGERETNSQQFKQTGDGFRIDDTLYRYGPDRKGQVYYLGFRDGMLINFDPEHYAEEK